MVLKVVCITVNYGIIDIYTVENNCIFVNSHCIMVLWHCMVHYERLMVYFCHVILSSMVQKYESVLCRQVLCNKIFIVSDFLSLRVVWCYRCEHYIIVQR